MPKVNVKGVKSYVSNGTVYAYDRISGTRLTPPHVIGTPEWFTALEAARAKVRPTAERPGTWGALVTLYRESPRFGALARRSQADYQGVLDYLKPLHDVAVSKWTRGFVAGLRDKAQKARGPRFANYVLSVVSIIFSLAIEREIADANPVQGVNKVRRPRTAPRANRPWSDEEWQAVTSAAPAHLLAPILLAGILGYRQGEAISAPRNSWNRTSDTLTRTSAKSGKIVKVPVPRVIKDALLQLPANDATTLLVSTKCVPWSEDGFRASFFKLLRRLEGQGRVAKGLTFHGLRHTAATRMRQLGFDTRTIADMLGQETEGMAAHYSREADLEPKLRGVVHKLDRENRKRTKAV